METSRLKRYAPEARQAFIAAVSAQAARLGITATGISEAREQGDVLLVDGQAFPRAIRSARKTLVDRVQAHGFDATIDAIAYTWFNRFMAIRYMELHGY
ncbi:MAG: SAM-dependent methyltransferase, partial [Gammaproteobacteria bacterium]|nr:SAM-dependent methyltransferase [Gammaproteobacteria bacterium]